jgi:hypothetical protein
MEASVVDGESDSGLGGGGTMSAFSELAHRLQRLFNPKREDANTREELSHHLEMLTRELVSQGHSHLEATRRAFDASDNTPGGAPIAAISTSFWRTAFNANPAVIGSTIEVDEVK